LTAALSHDGHCCTWLSVMPGHGETTENGFREFFLKICRGLAKPPEVGVCPRFVSHMDLQAAKRHSQPPADKAPASDSRRRID